MSRKGKRFVSLKLLELLSSVANKRTEMERVGIQIEVMADLQEKVSNTLFEVNGINPREAGALYLSLEDWLSGVIDDHVMLSLVSGVVVG